MRPSSSNAAIRDVSGGRGGGGGPAAAGRANEIEKATIINYSGIEDPTQEISGITVVAVPSISGGMSQNASLLATYALVTTTAGRTIRIDFGKLLGSNTTINPANSSNNSSSNITTNMTTLFHYHIGTVTGLCTAHKENNTIIATAGDDRRICVWNVINKTLQTRSIIIKSSIICLSFDATTSFLAIGLANGGVTIMSYIPIQSQRGSERGSGAMTSTEKLFGTRINNNTIYSEFTYILREVCFRKDSKECISDLKFSSDNTKLAVGSHDNMIYIYTCTLDTSDNLEYKFLMRPLLKISGHSSYITHIDWSLDSMLIQSTCGAYELL